LLLRLRRSGLLLGEEAEEGESDESESEEGDASQDLLRLRRLVSFASLPISFSFSFLFSGGMLGTYSGRKRKVREFETKTVGIPAVSEAVGGRVENKKRKFSITGNCFRGFTAILV